MEDSLAHESISVATLQASFMRIYRLHTSPSSPPAIRWRARAKGGFTRLCRSHIAHAVLLRRLYNGVHVLTAGRKRLFYQNMLSRTGSIHRHLSVQMIRRRH